MVHKLNDKQIKKLGILDAFAIVIPNNPDDGVIVLDKQAKKIGTITFEVAFKL